MCKENEEWGEQKGQRRDVEKDRPDVCLNRCTTSYQFLYNLTTFWQLSMYCWSWGGMGWDGMGKW